MESVELFLAVGRQLLVHAVARRRRAEMRQSGAGQMQMGRVRVVDRRQQPALPAGAFHVDRVAKPLALDEGGQANPGTRRLQRQRIDAARPIDDARLAAVAGDDADRLAVVEDLGYQHGGPFFIRGRIRLGQACGKTNISLAARVARRMRFSGILCWSRGPYAAGVFPRQVLFLL